MRRIATAIKLVTRVRSNDKGRNDLPNDQDPELDQTAQRLDALFPCSPLPQKPPFPLLEMAAEALADLDPVGPRYDRGDLLQRVEKGVFVGPRVKTFVDNNTINWVKGRKSLQRAILARLECGDFSGIEIMNHLRRVKRQKLPSARLVSFSSEQSDDEILGRCLVYVRTKIRIKHIDARGTTYEYAVCGSEWASFFWGFGKLERVVSELGVKCLQDARALAIEEDGTGGRLMHPNEWQEKARIWATVPEYRFFLTRDLPDSWFYANLGPRGREERKKKKAALKWLNNLHQEVAPSGRKATKADVLAELRRRFGITTIGLLNDIWKEAKIELWRKRGAPKKENRYLFEKL